MDRLGEPLRPRQPVVREFRAGRDVHACPSRNCRRGTGSGGRRRWGASAAGCPACRRRCSKRTLNVLAPGKLGKGGRLSSETFRNNPAGNQSRPVAPGQRPEASFASGAGNCIGRSVNSASQGRAIEPRKLVIRGSLRCGHSGGHADMPQGPGVLGPAGVEEQGIGTAGCPGTWEALLASLRIFPVVGTGS
jgi:hypothetical protein